MNISNKSNKRTERKRTKQIKKIKYFIDKYVGKKVFKTYTS